MPSDYRKFTESTEELRNIRVVRELWPYIRPHKWRIFLVALLMVYTVGVALYVPLLLGKIVDTALIPRDRELLLRLGALFVALELGWMAAKICESYVLQKIGQSAMQQLRLDLFGRLIRMPVAFYSRHPTGKLVTRIVNDTANLMEIFGSGFVTLFADILVVLGVLVAMILLDWKLGLIAIAVFPIMVYAMNYFSRRLRLAYRRARLSLSSLNAFFAERVTGMPIVQLMRMEEHERSRFNELSRDYFQKQMGSVRVFAFFHPTITVLTAASITLVLYFGGIFVASGALPIGVFVSFLAYIQILFQPVRALTEKYNIYQNAMSSAEQIFSLLALEEEAGLRTGAGARTRLRGEIEFANVWFSYDDSHGLPLSARNWALRDANFRIVPQEKIAVVGHTGAGKSTLLNLLFRFHDPQRGAILVDGREISSYPKQFLRRRFGFVQQDVFIFAGTIRENLCLLGENVSETRLLEACRATGMDRIVAALPAGYDTRLDERGSNLSLGERQVLAITRVLLQEPDVLVLDEATSHVDTESERILQRAMDEVTKNRTSLVIAHRLSTIRNADRIFVFEKGEIVECGSHAALVAKRGAYYQFTASQDQI